jgi:hypothetical protein
MISGIITSYVNDMFFNNEEKEVTTPLTLEIFSDYI